MSVINSEGATSRGLLNLAVVIGGKGRHILSVITRLVSHVSEQVSTMSPG